ncbi:hypothetical protein F8M41_022609 [Gigaspora margarita]|uniref:Uncharacterized protein n=1 Tax=Gigaspora margarita TaxID=4874 RepID=A0A8H4EI33_GIGMA|nr:hypothetical protein F8M41_022609 [Gigaspora margarita]
MSRIRRRLRRNRRNRRINANLPNLTAVQLHADLSNGMPNLFATETQHQQQLNIATEFFYGIPFSNS